MGFLVLNHTISMALPINWATKLISMNAAKSPLATRFRMKANVQNRIGKRNPLNLTFWWLTTSSVKIGATMNIKRKSAPVRRKTGFLFDSNPIRRLFSISSG